MTDPLAALAVVAGVCVAIATAGGVSSHLMLVRRRRDWRARSLGSTVGVGGVVDGSHLLAVLLGVLVCLAVQAWAEWLGRYLGGPRPAKPAAPSDLVEQLREERATVAALNEVLGQARNALAGRDAQLRAVRDQLAAFRHDRLAADALQWRAGVDEAADAAAEARRRVEAAEMDREFGFG